jgi:hypothetical protein
MSKVMAAPYHARILPGKCAAAYRGDGDAITMAMAMAPRAAAVEAGERHVERSERCGVGYADVKARFETRGVPAR